MKYSGEVIRGIRVALADAVARRCAALGSLRGSQLAQKTLRFRLGAVNGNMFIDQFAPHDRDALDELAQPLQGQEEEAQQDEPLRGPDEKAARIRGHLPGLEGPQEVRD